MPEAFRKKRKGAVRPITDVLTRVMNKTNLKRGMTRARPLVAWSEVVGVQMARTTRAVAVRDGVMIVETQDSTAANFFTMQRGLYLEMLREKLGDEAPKDLRFQMGVFEHKVVGAKKTRLPALSKLEKARVGVLLELTPTDMQPLVRKTAEALERVRAERVRRGFLPCPVCSSLTEPEPSGAVMPCSHCKNTMANPLVQSACKSLIRNPDLALKSDQNGSDQNRSLEKLFVGATGDAVDCAVFLALEYFQGQLEMLLMQVVKSRGRGRPKKPLEDEAPPEMLFYLEATAKAFLALKLGKSVAVVTRKDYSGLPERVRHVLEAGTGV
jgi:hypothetical protein